MPLSVSTRVSFRNILIATDFSCCSEAVFPYARSLAHMHESNLFLVHVISPEMLAADPLAVDGARVNAERLMEDLELSEQINDLPHRNIIAEGETWGVIQQIIDQEHVDLVIAGTHGRTGLKRLVLGSVAERIFRNAECPVMTIGPQVAADAKRIACFDNVLVALDVKNEYSGPLYYGASLAAQHKATLTLLYVTETDMAEEEVLALLPNDLVLERPATAVIARGEIVHEILASAASSHADLLVIGAHRPGLSRSMRNIAYGVVCDAPCPVLTVADELKE